MSTLFLFCSLLILSPGQPGVSPANLALLGPFPVLSGTGSMDWSSVSMKSALEINPRSALNLNFNPGKKAHEPGNWELVAADRILEPGVYWVTADLRVERAGHVRIRFQNAKYVKLFLEDRALPVSVSPEADLFLGKAVYRMVFRVELPEKSALELTAQGDENQGLAWFQPGIRPMCLFDQTHELMRADALAISGDGQFLASAISGYCEISGRKEHEYALFDRSGRKIQNLSGKPICFHGDDLFVLEGNTCLKSLNIKTMNMTMHLLDEKGFQFLEIQNNGTGLLFFSSQFVEQTLPPEGEIHRHLHSRQTVPDYTVSRALWLLDLESGVRRLIAPPGDWVLDDACFVGNDQVAYARNVPRPDRPWFTDELRLVSLKTGQDRLLDSLVFGWEVRAFDLLYDDAQQKLIFTGPPEEVGRDRKEHNVYNRQLWSHDMNTGKTERISSRTAPSTNGSNLKGFPVKTPRGIFALVDFGSSVQLAKCVPGVPGKESREFKRITTLGETISPAVLSNDGRYLFYQASSRDEMPFLAVTDLKTGESRRFKELNRIQSSRYRVLKPVNASVKAPEGHQVEAWAYLPKDMPEKCPVALYYYGGASPTVRTYNPTHQFFAANGYAVLVVNPRGAYGYGDAYADSHAGDWGPRASSDILLCLDAFLAGNKKLDHGKVGIYGGSYGGFMTEYLVSVTDRFAAAVSLYGISDIASYWGEGMWGWTYGDMASAGKTPYDSPDLMVKHSPLYRAEKIHTPLLLLHGESDLNVRPEESIQLFTALERLNRPVELVLFPGETHGISSDFSARSNHRTMILDWFDFYLKDQPEAWRHRWGK